MGNSASATLFFGAPFEARDDEHGSHEDLDDWEGRLAAARGVPSPSEPFGDGIDQEVAARYLAYWDAKRGVVAAEPCAIGWAGSGYDSDSSFWYVYIKASATKVEWGPPEPVKEMKSTPEQVEALVNFCQLMGISYDCGLFGWHLAAFYG